MADGGLVAARPRADRCPGALALHEAADGPLARIRLPGGFVPAAALAGLADLAERLGNGALELTSRGNVQLRALTDPGAVAEAVADLGLLPSPTHERVRNVLASPLAGLDGAGPDLVPLVADLDRRLCARAGLADLPGRFLFALDDGRGDVLALGPDAAATYAGAGRWLVTPAGVAVDQGHVVTALLATAEAFLAERAAHGGTAWRIADLPAGPHAVANRVRAALGLPAAPAGPAGPAGPVPQADGQITANQHAQPPAAPAGPAGPTGVVPQADGRVAVAVVVPLGRLRAGPARLLASHAGPRGLRVTPWRGVIVPDLAAAEPFLAAARAAGLDADAGSPWYGVSACTGRPGCASARADVQADAAAARHEPRRLPAHWSGCERRCGHPAGPYLDVLATGGGYQVRESAP